MERHPGQLQPRAVVAGALGPQRTAEALERVGRGRVLAARARANVTFEPAAQADVTVARVTRVNVTLDLGGSADVTIARVRRVNVTLES